jgi:hypothetical protein
MGLSLQFCAIASPIRAVPHLCQNGAAWTATDGHARIMRMIVDLWDGRPPNAVIVTGAPGGRGS